jgi:hypothetical protein
MRQVTITVRLAWWLTPLCVAMAIWRRLGLPLTDRTIARIARKGIMPFRPEDAKQYHNAVNRDAD